MDDNERQVALAKTRAKYALYALLVISGLVIGAWITPDHWLSAVKILFGGLWQ